MNHVACASKPITLQANPVPLQQHACNMHQGAIIFCLQVWCMQHASRCDHFSFASLMHNSVPFVVAHFLHSLATATAFFSGSSEPLIQLAPVSTCPNMHTHIANSVVILEVQSCLVVELMPKCSRAPEGALCLHYGGLWSPW